LNPILHFFLFDLRYLLMEWCIVSKSRLFSVIDEGGSIEKAALNDGTANLNIVLFI